MPLTDCDPGCPPACNPFARVAVDRAFAQGTRVGWTLQRGFSDPRPHEFTLYFGHGLQAGADGWQQVGDPVVDAYAAYDFARRDRGVVTRARYKVRLDTPLGAYESDPVDALGLAGEKDFIVVDEARRKMNLQFRLEDGTPGFLFKLRTTGERCEACGDEQTLEPTDPYCPVCYGTGYLCGYYRPAECVWALFKPGERQTDLDARRNVVERQAVRATICVVDLVETGDLFVDARDDSRFSVVRVRHTAMRRRVPVSADVDFLAVPFTSKLYDLPVPKDLFA